MWRTIAAMAAAGILSGQTIQVRLQVEDQSEWKTVDARTVLKGGDRIRFEFRSDAAGYLYVLNRSSAGQTAQLFPNRERRETNRIEAGQPLILPGTAGNYVVDGPPGYEVTYWILSPDPLQTGIESLDWGEQKPLPDTLLPKCRDFSGSKRGPQPCLDPKAGPAATQAVSLPASTGLRAREIRIENRSQQSQVKASSSKAGPIIYEFRIAHR